MAIDLKAKISLVDNISSKLNSITKTVQRTERQTSGFSKTLERTSNAGARNFGILNSGIAKVAAGLGSAIGAAKLFDATIKSAAEFEQQSVLVEAIFNEKKLSDSYTKMLQRVAEKSPLLDSSAMMANSSGLVSITKDVGQLEKAWGIVERLNVVNPKENIEGAIIALKELNSGDVVSLSERFNIGKKQLNDLKKLDFKDQLAGLDKYLNGIGITDKAVDAMGQTSIGRLNQIKERLSSLFRGAGADGNKGIGKALDGILTKVNSPQFDKFAQTMNVKIGGAITKATNAAIRFGTYVQNNWSTISPIIQGVALAFAGLAAIKVVIGIFASVTTVVMGVVKVVKALGTVIGFAVKAFKFIRLAMLLFPGSYIVLAIGLIITAAVLLCKNFDKVKATAAKAWEKLKEVRSVGGLVKLAFQGIKTAAEKSINFVLDKINAMIEKINKIPGINLPTIGKVGGGSGNYADTAPNRTFGAQAMGYAGGIANVRRDRMPAYLHEGERVLTKEQNDAYNAGNGGNVYNLHVTMNSTGYTRKDAEKLLDIMASQLHTAAAGGA